jgi:outer membrane protein OmpA-like peptidoglycan-associated protein
MRAQRIRPATSPLMQTATRRVALPSVIGIKVLLATPLFVLGVAALTGCSDPERPNVLLNADDAYEPTLVFFDWDSTEITTQAAAAVMRVAREFKRQPGCITLRAHADASGSADYNMALSARRGAAVKEALMREGVPGSAISVIARGQSAGHDRPMADAESGRQSGG